MLEYASFVRDLEQDVVPEPLQKGNTDWFGRQPLFETTREIPSGNFTVDKDELWHVTAGDITEDTTSCEYYIDVAMLNPTDQCIIDDKRGPY